MSQSARTAASIDWKRRYAQLLEQQEKQQARYKRKQDLLVNALAQVSQYSRHLDPAADEKLMALRALLRQDNFRNVDLAQVVETLESQLTRSLKDRADKQKQTSKQLSDLVRQAQSMSKSTDLHTRLAELKQAIESQPVQYSTLANHLTSLSQLHALAVKDRRSGQSMLQRWFGPAVP